MSANDLIPLALAFVGGVFGGVALMLAREAWRNRRAAAAFKRSVRSIEAVDWPEPEGGAQNSCK